MKKLTAFAALLFLVGCQTWGLTWSELTGSRYNGIASMTDGPVVVNQVDGVTPTNSPWEPTQLTPGLHKLVLQAVSPSSVIRFINLEETEVDFKPCVRYYINARFAESDQHRLGVLHRPRGNHHGLPGASTGLGQLLLDDRVKTLGFFEQCRDRETQRRAWETQGQYESAS